eukprot:PhF_6_TR38161/c0_g1_i1/m.57012
MAAPVILAKLEACFETFSKFPPDALVRYVLDVLKGTRLFLNTIKDDRSLSLQPMDTTMEGLVNLSNIFLLFHKKYVWCLISSRIRMECAQLVDGLMTLTHQLCRMYPPSAAIWKEMCATYRIPSTNTPVGTLTLPSDYVVALARAVPYDELLGMESITPHQTMSCISLFDLMTQRMTLQQQIAVSERNLGILKNIQEMEAGVMSSAEELKFAFEALHEQLGTALRWAVQPSNSAVVQRRLEGLVRGASTEAECTLRCIQVAREQVGLRFQDQVQRLVRYEEFSTTLQYIRFLEDAPVKSLDDLKKGQIDLTHSAQLSAHLAVVIRAKEGAENLCTGIETMYRKLGSMRENLAREVSSIKKRLQDVNLSMEVSKIGGGETKRQHANPDDGGFLLDALLEEVFEMSSNVMDLTRLSDMERAAYVFVTQMMLQELRSRADTVSPHLTSARRASRSPFRVINESVASF